MKQKFSLGIFTSLLGSLLPLPRVLYAIASDGLIFRFISWIHPRLQTPIVATILGGVSGGKTKTHRFSLMKNEIFVCFSDYGVDFRFDDTRRNDVDRNFIGLFISFGFCVIFTVKAKEFERNKRLFRFHLVINHPTIFS